MPLRRTANISATRSQAARPATRNTRAVKLSVHITLARLETVFPTLSAVFGPGDFNPQIGFDILRFSAQSKDGDGSPKRGHC
jgi:hypothetical protein